MTVELVLPWTLAEFTVGESPPADVLSDYLLDGECEDDCVSFSRFFPNVKVGICDGLVVSVDARDECWFGGIDLIGLSRPEVIEHLALPVLEVEPGVAEFVHLAGGVTLLVIEGVVRQLAVSDYGLIPDN